MSDITITVTEIVDGVSVESTPTAITVTDGVFVDSGAGGGGAVSSVNGETGAVVLSASDVGAQPVDTDLTAIAALSTTTFGRALLTLADGPAVRSAIGAGTSSFDGAYSSLTGTPTLGTAAAAATTDFDAAGAAATAQAASQPLDSDLTAIAALTTTTFGRSLLTQADAAAARTTLGAGTSSLAIGTSSSTAKAGDYQPASTNISDATTIGKTILTAADAAAVRTAISAAAATHTHAESDVTNLTSDLAAKAPLASPTFTGTPAAPTATGGTNTTQIATTAFVTAAVVAAGGYVDPLTTKGDIVGRSSSATVRKGVGTNGTALFADSTQTDGLNWRAIAESDVTNLTTDLAAKAPLASPTFTGTVTIPTATAADSSTKAASTAFVQGELTAKAPLASPTFTGTPAAPTVAGTTDSTTKIATTAFVQAVAALLAPLASPALTGNPTATTQTAGNNSTRIATTAYVDSAVAAGPIDATKVTHTIQAQTGTSYTLVLGDAGKFVTMTNASASTLTVPPNSSVAFPVGTMIDGAQLGAGQVTLTAGAGVTINATPGLKVAAQYGTFGLLKTATDAWVAYGRLSA